MIDDYGKSARMANLERDFNTRVATLATNLGWSVEITARENYGEYLLATFRKDETVKSLSLMYSQATDHKVYDRLDGIVDACLINGMGGINAKYSSFSRNFTKPLLSIGDVLEVIKEWDVENAGVTDKTFVKKQIVVNEEKSISDIIRISGENPSEQVWTMLKMLRSAQVCKKVITSRNTKLPSEQIESKSMGLAFLIQNACEYFESANEQNTTQRLLSLYYGTLAFMEADMLINSPMYSGLNEIEKITTGGHGLYTFDCPDVDQGLDNFFVGVLGRNRGIFPAWLEVQGINIDNFPTKKDKIKGDYSFRLDDVLFRIPEISTIMEIISDDYKPGFLTPHFPIELNKSGGLWGNSYASKVNGSYIILFDKSQKSTIDIAKTLIGSFAHIENYESKDFPVAYRAFLLHDTKYWWESLNIHRSSSCRSALLSPLNGCGDSWETYAIMILYAISIIVRYRPNLWRRIESGEWDKYLPVFLSFSLIAEKVLPHIFFEKIYGQKLHVSQGSIWG